MQRAVSRLSEAPTSLLLGPVGPARREAQAELGDLGETIHTASLLFQGLPSFLGAEEPQRYFFGAQNPAELRGTGGLIGAYSILEIDHGRFHFSPFVPIHGLAQPPLKSIAVPNEDYSSNYDQFRRGGRFWTSINVMPDFPSVAREILISYEAATGTRLDGVILADPFAEATLLAVSGPVKLPGYHVQIDAENVVAFTTNEAYSLFTDSVRRKRLLGDVARAAFERLPQPARCRPGRPERAAPGSQRRAHPGLLRGPSDAGGSPPDPARRRAPSLRGRRQPRVRRGEQRGRLEGRLLPRAARALRGRAERRRFRCRRVRPHAREPRAHVGTATVRHRALSAGGWRRRGDPSGPRSRGERRTGQRLLRGRLHPGRGSDPRGPDPGRDAC